MNGVGPERRLGPPAWKAVIFLGGTPGSPGRTCRARDRSCPLLTARDMGYWHADGMFDLGGLGGCAASGQATSRPGALRLGGFSLCWLAAPGHPAGSVVFQRWRAAWRLMPSRAAISVQE